MIYNTKKRTGKNDGNRQWASVKEWEKGNKLQRLKMRLEEREGELNREREKERENRERKREREENTYRCIHRGRETHTQTHT